MADSKVAENLYITMYLLFINSNILYLFLNELIGTLVIRNFQKQLH